MFARCARPCAFDRGMLSLAHHRHWNIFARVYIRMTIRSSLSCALFDDTCVTVCRLPCSSANSPMYTSSNITATAAQRHHRHRHQCLIKCTPGICGQWYRFYRTCSRGRHGRRQQRQHMHTAQTHVMTSNQPHSHTRNVGFVYTKPRASSYEVPTRTKDTT